MVKKNHFDEKKAQVSSSSSSTTVYYVARSIDQQLRHKDKYVEDAETDEEKQERLRNYRIEPVIGIFLMCFSLEECDTELKQWLYVINNSRKMEQIPFAKDKPLFDQLKEIAKHHALTPEQQELYDNELRNEIAYHSSIVLREERAAAKARAEKELENARRLISEEGWSLEKAASFFGLTPEAIALN